MTSPIFPCVFYFTKSPYHVRVYQILKSVQRIPAPSFIKKLPAMKQGVYSFVYEITSVAEASSVVCSTGVSSVCVAFANEPTY